MFCFAWVDPTETTFGPEHQVYDENVFSFSVQGQEGECAVLNLTIRNPKVGLLSAGRKVWAWLSHDGGTAVTPLFFGRLVGIPNFKGGAETVDLIFVAKPFDYAVQRRELATALAVLPYYDKIFIDPDLRISEATTSNAATGALDTVLEAYAARFHCSRGEDGGPLTVTISDIIQGEDGTIVFTGSGDVDHDSVAVSIASAPKTSVEIKAHVTWKRENIAEDVPALDLGQQTIITYTGASLISGWPKPGQSLGGGWAAADGTFAIDNYAVAQQQIFTRSFHWENGSKEHTQGDSMSLDINDSSPLFIGPSINILLTRFSQPGIVSETTNRPAILKETRMWIPLWSVTLGLRITYEAALNRNQGMHFVMTSDIQPVLTLPGDVEASGEIPPDHEILTLSGADVGVAIDGEVPIIDANGDDYWATPRGLQSTEYCVLRGRAVLLAGSRVVQVSFDCPFDRALDLTCRKNAQITSHHIPGGGATGKIVSYTIFADGATGKLGGTVTMACAIGRSGSPEVPITPVEPVEGTGDYVDDAYVVTGYQTAHTGAIAVPGGSTAGGDVGYSLPVYVPNQTPYFPLTRSQAVLSDTWHGSTSEQEAAIASVLPAIQRAANLATIANPTIQQQQEAHILSSVTVENALQNHAIWRELHLLNVEGSAFDDVYDITVTPLVIPRMIDLEAATTA